MNLKTIMCPTDYSRSSEAALSYATLLASESGACLYIVHVHEGLPTFVPGYAGYDIPMDSADAHEKEAREALDRVVPTTPGVQYVHWFLTGAPEKEILAFAGRENVDLIVMGSHGRTGVARVLMGSVAEAIVRKASCPVLTIKQPKAADPPYVRKDNSHELV
jgi:universal stress protein A